MRRKVVSLTGELLFISLVLLAIAGMAVTAQQNLQQRNIATGFSFLFHETGWDVSGTWLAHTARDPYWWTLVVGLVNTLAIGFISAILATILGVLLALLRALENRVISALIDLYIATIRNVPLIVQLFFWYAATRNLPANRSAYSLGDMAFLSNRGLYLPSVKLDAPYLYAFVLALVAAFAGLHYINRRREAAGDLPISKWTVPGLAAAVFAVLFAVQPETFSVSVPHLAGFNFEGGLQLSPELVVLLLGIVTYNTAFIAEIVRSGVDSVSAGQREAAQNIGLGKSQIFWRVIMPQAIRVMIPSLINQYANITKASALAVAIGFTDLFSVGTITINHTGQSLEVILILMATYLVINLLISVVGNLYDSAVGRRWKR